MSRRKLAQIKARSTSYPITYTVHYETVPGQFGGYTLCSWDGGVRIGETDEPVTCRECLAIMGFFRPKSKAGAISED